MNVQNCNPKSKSLTFYSRLEWESLGIGSEWKERGYDIITIIIVFIVVVIITVSCIVCQAHCLLD